MNKSSLKSTELLTFTVPLTAKFRRQAEQFKSQQSHPEKGEKVYQNTLAVLAVNFYCQCLGIETDLENSESFDLVMQSLSNTATLSLKEIGDLECLPICLASR